MNTCGVSSWILALLFILFSTIRIVQSSESATLQFIMHKKANDTARVNRLIKLAYLYPKIELQTEVYLKHALEEAKQSQETSLVQKLSFDLYTYFLKKGDSLQSLRYLIKYQSIQDSLFTMNAKSGIVNFESEIQAQAREKEIEHLQIQKNTQRNYYVIGAVFLFVIVLGGYSRISYIRRTEKEKLTAEFKKQLAISETKALRAQMNPHFIFNCLNSINCFIIENEHDMASEYLIKFSKLIRLIMENSNNEIVSLKKELDALKLYIMLESARYENKISCEFSIDKCINTDTTKIPPMLLQPFVENAIWHGLMHKETNGSIHIIIKRAGSKLLKISIIDDGIGREKAAELKSKSGTHKSFGLEITAHRIDMMNKLNSSDAKMHIIDLKDDSNNAIGTRIDLTIPI